MTQCSRSPCVIGERVRSPDPHTLMHDRALLTSPSRFSTPSHTSGVYSFFFCPVRRQSVQTRVHRGPERGCRGMGVQGQVQQEARSRGEASTAGTPKSFDLQGLLTRPMFVTPAVSPAAEDSAGHRASHPVRERWRHQRMVPSAAGLHQHPREFQ